MEISKHCPKGQQGLRSLSSERPKENPVNAMNPKIHFCPRCKQDRMEEWFGDPKAPYAICLSCRVEVNGEKKTKTAKVRIKRAECAICTKRLSEHDLDLCIKCEAGVNSFEKSPKLLGRAASYCSGQLRKPHKKQHIKRQRIKNEKLRRLISQQARDDRERGLRFEHAISKP